MIRDRIPTAIFASLFGVATAIGGLLTWIGAHGARPTMGMDHTSLSKVLVYTLVIGTPVVRSVGFSVVLLGILMVIGGWSGLRIFTVLGAVLALAVGAMWIGLVTHHYNTPQLPNSYYLNPAKLPWSDLRQRAWLTTSGAVLGLLCTFVPSGWNPVLTPRER
jgi:hypothetical protein